MSPELLAPAGGFDAALAAFQYGADAVYLGLPRFSARADADNVTSDRLRALLAYARTFSPAKKIYVTFNTLVQDRELGDALDALDELDALAPDGVIVQDLGVARLIRDHFPRLALHASTQLAAHNLDGVLALRDLGFSRVVLARELTLREIARIVNESGVEIEVFVHGALCYSYSGLCLFSSHASGRSGNRGRCAYCCREAFQSSGTTDLRPPTSGHRFSYPFSMRDLAWAPVLDDVVRTGAHSLKIEGRMKSPLYVACVSDYYRRKLDGTLTPEAEHRLVQDLQTVFSRPWTTLYAASGQTDPDAVIDPLAIGHRGAPIGQTDTVVRDRDGTRWLRFVTARAIEKHDGLQVELPDGGKPFGFPVDALRTPNAARTVITLPTGATVEVALPADDVPTIPRGAPVFCSASQAVRRRYAIAALRDDASDAGRPASFAVTLAPEGIAAHATADFETPGDLATDVALPIPLQPSKQPDQTPAAVRRAFARLGDTEWRLGTLDLSDPFALYAPASKLNEARRALAAALSDAWRQRRAARREAVSQRWCLGDSPAHARRGDQPARTTLKLRADAAPLPNDVLHRIDALVLAVGHLQPDALRGPLDAWRRAFGPGRIRLALPLISRGAEAESLKATLRTLQACGWTEWECADLAGCRMLRAEGLSPAAADWSLYAFNRVAAAELARLGVGAFVCSPENGLDNILALIEAGTTIPEPEVLAFQHTPLFLSATAPCLPGGAKTAEESALVFTDRRKTRLICRHLDDLWVTVRESAFCVADRLAEFAPARIRIDLSWSPRETDFAEIIRSVQTGRCPPDTHPANFGRGLA